MIGVVRKCLAAGLTLASVTWPALAQDLSIEPVRPHAPVIVRPYLAPTVPRSGFETRTVFAISCEPARFI